MVQCVFGKDVSVLVIGVGVQGAIHVPQKTCNAIREAVSAPFLLKKHPLRVPFIIVCSIMVKGSLYWRMAHVSHQVDG
jgi:hypothetical protein